MSARGRRWRPPHPVPNPRKIHPGFDKLRSTYPVNPGKLTAGSANLELGKKWVVRKNRVVWTKRLVWTMERFFDCRMSYCTFVVMELSFRFWSETPHISTALAGNTTLSHGQLQYQNNPIFTFVMMDYLLVRLRACLWQGSSMVIQEYLFKV